jgi:hypothetical protein
LMEETARKHQTELHSANSRAAMARLAGTATKLTQTLELSPIFQFLIRDRLGNRWHTEHRGEGEIHHHRVLFSVS